MIKINPWKGVRAPADTARTRVLSYAEEARLRTTLRADYQRLVTVILGTGMREGELLGLRPKDLTGTHVWVTGKFGKSRKIPLRSDVRAALEAQRVGQTYWTQDASTLRQTLKEACVRAHVPIPPFMICGAPLPAAVPRPGCPRRCCRRSSATPRWR